MAGSCRSDSSGARRGPRPRRRRTTPRRPAAAGLPRHRARPRSARGHLRGWARTRRTGRRADFLVVEGGQHGDRRTVRQRRAGVRHQRREPGVRRGEVVEPAGGEEFALCAEHRRGLGVRDDDVVPADLRRIHLGVGNPVREESEQVLAGGIAQAEHRIHVLLLVQGQALIDGPVQVDGELREAQQRARGREVLRAVAHDEPAGELEFAVQPGVQEGSAVDLDAGLQPAELARGGLRLEFEGRRVRVGAEDVETRGRSGACRHHPGDEGAVADHVELAGGGGPGLRPGLQFVQAREARPRPAGARPRGRRGSSTATR